MYNKTFCTVHEKLILLITLHEKRPKVIDKVCLDIFKYFISDSCKTLI